MTTRGRTPVVAGNWKMNGDEKACLEIALRVREGVGDVVGVEKVVCPPFLYLHIVADHMRDSDILIGAQNCHWEDKGAFTGEVSPAMLRGLVDYVIVGHSERRAYFNETDETVNKKVQAVIAHGLLPIMCIGESLDQREGDRSRDVVEAQLKQGLEGTEIHESFIIAYEPVWAIGTGVPATAEMANETIGEIRNALKGMYGQSLSEATRILYGGSVSTDNFAEIMDQPEIDGGLIGGASLKADDFNKLVKIAAKPRSR
jgi:triosephosphate isomerase (TIM)